MMSLVIIWYKYVRENVIDVKNTNKNLYIAVSPTLTIQKYKLY